MSDDSEKLDAMHQVNQIWQQAAGMPPGEKRDKYLRVAHKVASKVAEAYDMPLSGEGPIDTVAKGVMRAVGYGAGLVQAPVLATAEALGGKEGKWKDVLTHAIDPRETPYTTGEVAQDIGVPEGGHASDVIPGFAEPGTKHSAWQPERGGLFDVSARGAGTSALDFLLSPQGMKALLPSAEKRMAGLTATQIQNIENAAREARLAGPTVGDRLKSFGKFAMDPLGVATEKAGRGLYDSAFSDADRAASAAGTRPVSDVMWRNNVWGSPGSVANQSRDLVSKLGDKVGADIATARELKPLATVPVGDMTERAQGKLKQAMGIGGQSEGAEAASKRLSDQMTAAYGNQEGLAIQEAQDLKRSMQQQAADLKAYPPELGTGRGTLSPNTPMNRAEARQLGEASKETARAARRGVENLADEAEPGLGGNIYRNNSDIASLTEGQDALDKAASQSAFTQSKIARTTTGALVGGSGGMYYHDPYAAAVGAVIGAGMTSPTVRTGAGLLIGKSAPWATGAVRTYLDQKYNPWLREHQPFDNMGQ